ncbi:uncharacterized protein LY79DRAFT_673736 [Colletotrichum navitas]|uniref:Uncharacterized protein n=1 Tax=Colletotrichum navitas TaxID=681940 RepID=A0AAD8V0H6_9PEZI|nr:uncharacterized protein LY79DRAFT_673736 [Colletotrichum navitas]KAK1573284.1 hypothetical protein LY79DRAFT_673736 [Colletotrichum navitas]
MLLLSWSDLEIVLDRYPWARELAGIIPLSALIDFVDVPRRLHTYQLSGATLLWCWPVTPSTSRLLFSEKTKDATCCLDRFGRSQGLTCLDGRYGNKYLMANPETLRLCLSTAPRTVIHNTHDNMKRDNVCIYTLEVIQVLRAALSTTRNMLLNMYTIYTSAAIGAAAIKGWDAYGIAFWIVLCIATNTYVFNPENGASAWMCKHARLRLDMFVTQVSSRRALLNVFMALNRDTFDVAGKGFGPGSLMWIDPVLHAGPSRSRCEETVAAAQTEDWKRMYADYWVREILKGVEIAEKIIAKAGLTGRFVKQTTSE